MANNSKGPNKPSGNNNPNRPKSKQGQDDRRLPPNQPKGPPPKGQKPVTNRQEPDDFEDDEEIDLQAEENPGLEGIALFPDIPRELGIDPLLESLISMVVFITASDEDLVNPKAADEAFTHLQNILSKLGDKRLSRLREELVVIAGWVKDQGLGTEAVEFIENFLDEMGVE
jgi:hypothetical protein